MALSRPSARISLDGRAFSAAELGLVRVEVRLSVLGRHDEALLVAWPGSRLAEAAVGAALVVELGEAGDEEAVLTGEVTAVRSGPVTVEVEGLAGTVALSRTRAVQAFVGVGAADIVRELAGDVTVDAAESPVRLEAWSVDDRRTVWAHLRALATRVGAELGASAEGGLRFTAPRTGPIVETLRVGAELLDWRVGARAAPTPPAIAAHGAASEAGSQRWHWLQRDPGGGEPVRVVGGFHTRDAVDALAKALEGRAARGALEGWLLAVGRAAARAGDLFAVDGIAGVDAVRVLEVRHRLDGGGFVSRLTVEGAGGGLGL